MGYMEPSYKERIRLQKSHTKQVETLIRQISRFTEKNFATHIVSEDLVVSNTCTPDYIEFADDKLVYELKKYVAFLHEQLEEYDPKKKFLGNLPYDLI